MKKIKYQIAVSDECGEVLTEKNISCTEDTLEANIAVARKEAYLGEYTVEDDGVAGAPTQLDAIEAQVAYTAMMTDTLLEV